MRMMLPFLIALRFDGGSAAQWQHLVLWVLGRHGCSETFCTANAGHARMPASPLGVGGACGRACALQGRGVLLSEVPRAVTYRNPSTGRRYARTGTRETMHMRMTNQRKNNYKDD